MHERKRGFFARVHSFLRGVLLCCALVAIGLLTALSSVAGNDVFLVAVDQPMLRADTVLAILETPGVAVVPMAVADTAPAQVLRPDTGPAERALPQARAVATAARSEASARPERAAAAPRELPTEAPAGGSLLGPTVPLRAVWRWRE